MDHLIDKIRGLGYPHFENPIHSEMSLDFSFGRQCKKSFGEIGIEFTVDRIPKRKLHH
jgi:hypothetical protein